MLIKKISLLTFTTVLFCTLPAIARVNILEPWQPGLDFSTNKSEFKKPSISLLAGEHFTEIPVQTNFSVGENSEAGARWGLISKSGNIGINDLNIGAKYQFIDGSGEKPAVIGEFACSLPTGDKTKALGTGSVNLWLHWALAKKIQTDLTGYFGLGLGLYSENSDKVRIGDIFYYHIGLSMPYEKNKRLHAEIKGFNHDNTKINGFTLSDSYQELYLAPGINLMDKRGTITAGFLIGLTPKSNDIGVLISWQL